MDDISGKKIFILYPHSVIKDEMLDILIMAGFETYTLSDQKRALKLIIKFPGSIMFINIDEGLKEPEWEAYIKDIKEKPETKDTKIGILSYNTDQKLMQKYLMKVGVECGYVQLKLGVKESTRIMLTALEANEARGRRKFIRAECADDSTSTANIKSGTGFFNGKILDISAVGIAAKFDKPIEYNTNQVIPGVQMRLHGSILMTDMIFMGKRADNVAVLLFDPKMPADKKLLVHRYIKQCLQRFMDNLKI